jgi:amino acid adenylation domain-containing protein
VEIFEQTNYEFTVSVVPCASGLEISFKYDTGLFDPLMVNRIMKHYFNVIDSFCTLPNTGLSKIEYLTEAEKLQLLEEFNDTKVSYPHNETVIDLFEAQVDKTPDKIALIFGDESLSYRELNEKANQFSEYLRKQYIIEPEDMIGIRLKRSKWMVVSILGVLKSGGAYVPIDLEYPEERVQYMMHDSNCKLLIDEQEIEKFEKVLSGFDTNNLSRIVKPGNLAYVIYTSGTTGNPKGVLIEHQSLNARINYFIRTYRLTSDDAVLFYRSYSFDGSIEEYLLPLMCGSKCIVAPMDFKQDILNNLFAYIEKYRITKINMPPVLLGEFIQAVDFDNLGKVSTLKHIVSGGDKLTYSIIHDFFGKFKALLYNTYGPTENTIDSTNWLADDTRGQVVPIGKPVENAKAFILDADLNLVPVGVYGELYVGGDGLARGYLNRPELTNEKFVCNPFDGGERMYKTGDRVRWLQDGNIEFSGRLDTQVKIRGFRIELGEIESVLETHEAIDKVIVIDRTGINKNKELIAYFTANGIVRSDELRKYLASKLPSFMIPGQFIQIDSLPLTINGKIDKTKLPETGPDETNSDMDFVSPRNQVEEMIVTIWQEILGRDKISVFDDFFELGGHSLLVTQLINRIYKETSVSVPVKVIFQNSTVDQFAKIKEFRHLYEKMSSDDYERISI